MSTAEFAAARLGTISCRAAAASDPGRKRTQNQDNFLIGGLTDGDGDIVLRPGLDAAEGRAAVELDLDRSIALLVVADGMGGAAAGRLASGLACSFILAELQASWLSEAERTASRFATHLRSAVSSANRQIHDHATRNPEYTGMGTTVTAVGVVGGTAYIAQVGDSRAYLVRGGAVEQLTHDQSLVQQLLDDGLITAEQAAVSEQGNLILQALGVELTVTVDVSSHELLRGDCIVVCCDGLYRVVSADEIAAAVIDSLDPTFAATSLVSLANERGAPDNVTVIAARFDGPGLAALAAGDHGAAGSSATSTP
jgi:PPM family protein phosphatase